MKTYTQSASDKKNMASVVFRISPRFIESSREACQDMGFLIVFIVGFNSQNSSHVSGGYPRAKWYGIPGLGRKLVPAINLDSRGR